MLPGQRALEEEVGEDEVCVRVLVDWIVDPAEFVLVKTMTLGDDIKGVKVETEVDVWIIVEPKEFVADDSTTMVDAV